jgi:hypothetical protein
MNDRSNLEKLPSADRRHQRQIAIPLAQLPLQRTRRSYAPHPAEMPVTGP